MNDKPRTPAKFVQGSIPKHVMVMTFASSAGLIGVFLVDLLDMFFLSLLGEAELAAAVGYAGSVTFFTTSVCIGFAIATSITVAKSLGQGFIQRAKKQFLSAWVLALVVALLILMMLMPNLGNVLNILGATGKTYHYALQYLVIVVPTLPFLVSAMCLSSVLRSLGAAKSAMMITLGGALINAILDPILIFGLQLGVEGAALASAISRCSMFVIGCYFVLYQQRFFSRLSWSAFNHHISTVFKLSIPAILTNQATPFANAYVVAVIAKFGDSAVAGYSIIGRMMPVAFALIFALSGAVGPIVGQNYGAKKYARIKHSVLFAYQFIVLYVIVVWGCLVLLASWIAHVFNATGEAESLLYIFIHYASLSFIFTGFLFVGNAVFNNLGKPHYSTLMNWLKATLGTIPFILIGAEWGASDGVIIGQAVGNVLFGLLSLLAVQFFLKTAMR